MIPKWEDRPVIVANLLNPAFCGSVLRIAIQAYQKETDKAFPFELIFLILPFILHKNTRDSLPTKSSKKFYEWIEDNSSIKIHITQRIKNLVPYSREAILFLLYHQVIEINELGQICVTPTTSRKKSIKVLNDDEWTSIQKKAEMFGKWLSKAGNSKTIFAIIGIKP